MRETDEPRTADEPPDATTPATPERPPKGAMEGADRAAMGISDPPQSAPPGASVDPSEHPVPGARFERPITEAKPWFTSLAAESEQAGVGNEPSDDDETDEDDTD